MSDVSGLVLGFREGFVHPTRITLLQYSGHENAIAEAGLRVPTLVNQLQGSRPPPLNEVESRLASLVDSATRIYCEMVAKGLVATHFAAYSAQLSLVPCPHQANEGFASFSQIRSFRLADWFRGLVLWGWRAGRPATQALLSWALSLDELVSTQGVELARAAARGGGAEDFRRAARVLEEDRELHYAHTFDRGEGTTLSKGDSAFLAVHGCAMSLRDAWLTPAAEGLRAAGWSGELEVLAYGVLSKALLHAACESPGEPLWPSLVASPVWPLRP